MSEEELETTTLLTTMMIEQDKETDIVEEIEEFEDKIEYLDISEEEKNKLKKICLEIKKEQDEKTRKHLFHLLQKEID